MCGVVERKSISNKRQVQSRLYIYIYIYMIQFELKTKTGSVTNSRSPRRCFYDGLLTDSTAMCSPLPSMKAETIY